MYFFCRVRILDAFNQFYTSIYHAAGDDDRFMLFTHTHTYCSSWSLVRYRCWTRLEYRYDTRISIKTYSQAIIQYFIYVYTRTHVYITTDSMIYRIVFELGHVQVPQHTYSIMRRRFRAYDIRTLIFTRINIISRK